MLPTDITSDLKTRLKTISGQINGLITRLDNLNDPEQLLQQFKAVDKGVQKAHHLLLDEVYRKALAIKIVASVDKCPGDCGSENKILEAQQQFPNIADADLSRWLKDMQEIEKRLNKNEN